MKPIRAYLLRSFYTLLLLLLSGALYANHLVGMDLFYTHVTGNTYKITLIAYANCGSGGVGSAYSSLPSNTPEIYIYNGNTYQATIDLAIQAPTTGVEITPVCPADVSLTQCTNISYTIPGITKFVYSGTYTLPSTSAVWRFLFTGNMLGGSIAGRATSITNISSTPDTYIQLVDSLDNTVSANSNPILNVLPTPFFCLNNADNYNPGAVDADGDSLTFSLVPGMSGTTTATAGTSTVSYIAPYTATAPLAASTFAFDPLSGQISFFPNVLQRSLVVYNIEERRNGVRVGTSQREMTFLVLTCTNSPATGVISSNVGGTIVNATHISVCSSAGPFSFHIFPTEANPLNNITVTYSGLPAGAIFNITGNGTNAPNCTFSWNTTGVALGSYTFYVTYTDNNCPLAGVQVLAYTITITAPPIVNYTLVSAATCVKRAAISIIPLGAGSPWIADISDAPGDTIQAFPSVTGTFLDSLNAGTYTLTLYTHGHGCSVSTPVTITAPPPIVPTATFTNPSYCGINDGTIKLYSLPAGTVDTIKYTYNGLTQPSLVRTIAADGTVLLTGMLTGEYYFTVVYGHCVSNTVGPIDLVTPPFTMRTISYTDPVYCGICNGTITLYGLHPGQTDTISYTRNDVFQPNIIATIGSDSTVELTGICSGTFDNFVAKTAGVCISNTLGPVTLVVPPFTMRTISHTNPDYCGVCNGTITLYGLHPGETDSISYTKDGVAQPVVVHAIGSDSTLVITGLCHGVYDNFIARTDGVCVSNTLGPVTLTVPPFTMRTLSHTNPDYCGICNGTITLYGLHPGETDSISYTKDGVAQTVFVHLVGSDSTLLLTGLCNGVYDNFVARTGGDCVSNTLGPVTLTVPPFTMRAVGSTNPDYCGICNGTITLYGLHPGESDTISYTKNGVSQTPFVHFIGSDSTVLMTGLCNGVYDNFIARTGGVCVSNTLGPVTLTVPPFTIRAIGSTNPDYCGICNGTITIYGVHPGESDTMSYTYNGVAQTPVVQFIAGDSLIKLTGLCAGNYANFVVRTGGVCVSNTLGPVSLTVPPFTVRTIDYTNPTKCGFCDGTIKLYGLHPGQTDTINYTLNGVAQPSLSYVIGSDSTITIAGLCKGTYANFVATTGGVCVSNTLGPVSLVDPPIIAAFSFVVHEGCGGDTVLFTNTSTPAPDLTYIWDFGDGGSSTAINPTHIYYSPGTMTVHLYITNTKCYDTTEHDVVLRNLINAGFTSVPDSFVCQGTPVVFTNTSIGDSLKYQWIFGDGSDVDTNRNVTHTYINTGHYPVVLVVSNYVPCFDTVRRTMSVDSITAISIAATDSVICGGGDITFTGQYATYGSTGNLWTFGDGSSARDVNPMVHGFSDAGYFEVTIEALYRACPDTSASMHVRIFPYPAVHIGADTSICPGGDPIELADNDNGASGHTTWLWSTGETSSHIVVVAPGHYYVTVTSYGCPTTDSIWVQQDCYMDIPNAFTPNGDGINDYFFPREMLTRGLTTFKMDIYNRWGELIFTTDNTNGRGWDGRFNGVAQPEGVFVFVIDATFKDGQKEHHKGTVTLLR